MHQNTFHGRAPPRPTDEAYNTSKTLAGFEVVRRDVGEREEGKEGGIGGQENREGKGERMDDKILAPIG